MASEWAIDPIRRNNVTITGDPAGSTLLFAHGFGCSQSVWRHVAPAFEATHRVVLLDYVGAGGSDSSAYDPGKYDSLDGYADDVLEIVEALDLRDVVFVGHSVGAMIGVLAANRAPERFRQLVLVGPSPSYLNDGAYRGGFEARDIDGLLDALDANYLDWAGSFAPVVMGTPDRPELGADLAGSFCRLDPRIARQFARVTFLSDTRRDLESVRVPTHVIHSAQDAIAPIEVGRFVHETIAGSRLTLIPVPGHVPALSGPDHLVRAIRDGLA